MQADNRKRAPAWTVREVLDLIAIWGEDSVLAELRSKRRNAKTFEKISKSMMERGHNRDSDQCRVKVKELRQAYQKTKEANGRSGSEPRTCRFYAELHAILGGTATTTPPVTVDSWAWIVSSATPEDSADGEEEEEEEEEDELAESTQHSVLPNSQDLFLSLTEVPSQPSQASIQDHDPMEGTSAAANSSSLPPPSRRLSQIRRRKKKTRDEMFAEIMESSRSDRAHLNEWKETVSKYRKEASEREDMRDQHEDMRDQREERRDQREERRDARDGGRKIRGGRMQCWGCCVSKQTCSGIWWSFRNGCRKTDSCKFFKPPSSVPKAITDKALEKEDMRRDVCRNHGIHRQ
ncbi:serine/threonine-protein kinase TAO2-like [Chrysemys picta bellii]|uniref:serine/threonine-protein kinase TAO2-like n=1 Tax=Chrysemys picta bellii TaxID=8478 RepID=UPI0032B0F909